MGSLLSIPSIASSLISSFCRNSIAWLANCCFGKSDTSSSSSSSNNNNNNNSTSRSTCIDGRKSRSSMKETATGTSVNPLGDVWQGTETRRAYQEGVIRSLVPDNNDNSTDENHHHLPPQEQLQVSFVNHSPRHDLIVCWVSATGEFFHYYRLAAKGGSLVETTTTGDAFVVFQVPILIGIGMENNNNNDEEQGRLWTPHEFCNAETVVAAYRPRRRMIQSTTFSDHDDDNIGNTETIPQPRHDIVSLTHTAVGDDTAATAITTNNNNQSSLASSWLRGTKKQRVGDVPTTTTTTTTTNKLEESEIKSWTVQVQKGESLKPAIAPIDTRHKFYHQEKIGFWTVHWEPGCWWDDTDTVDQNTDQKQIPTSTTSGATNDIDKELSRYFQALEADLSAVSQLIPPNVLDVLAQSTTLYLNRTHIYAQAVDNPVGCYHPGKAWLEQHWMNPHKCGHVEFYSVQEYYKHRQLWGTGGIILHELCHAYHQKHLPDGYENQDIRDCYQAAMEEKLYDSVSYHAKFVSYDNLGKPIHDKRDKTRHYACTNPMEYFAELSVAFLAATDDDNEYNKWYPHNRAQLQKHDPRAHELLKQLWGV